MMHQKLWIGTCAAIALAVSASLAAQTAAPAAATGAKSTDKVRVTGCVKRAAAGDASTKFMLTNVMPAASSTSSTGTSGTSGASSSPAATYRLDTDEKKLTPHVGHKVTIAGTFPVDQLADAYRQLLGPSSGAKAPKLKVDEVTMVASKCP